MILSPSVVSPARISIEIHTDDRHPEIFDGQLPTSEKLEGHLFFHGNRVSHIRTLQVSHNSKLLPEAIVLSSFNPISVTLPVTITIWENVPPDSLGLSGPEALSSRASTYREKGFAANCCPLQDGKYVNGYSSSASPKFFWNSWSSDHIILWQGNLLARFCGVIHGGKRGFLRAFSIRTLHWERNKGV